MQRLPPGIGNNYIIPGYQQSVPCQQYPYASNFNFPNSVIPGTLPCSQSLTDFVITTTSTKIPGFSNDVSIMNFGQGSTSTSLINSVPRSTPAVSSHVGSSSSSQITVSTNSSPIKNTPVSSASPATVVNPIGIENSCLSFVRSLMFRISKDDVVKDTVANFPLSDIKEAREILFKQTGSKTYRYQGPKDPATSHEKSRHAVLGIMQKIDDLANSGVHVKFYNSAEDLFRLSNMMISQSISKASDDFSKEKFDDMGRTIQSLVDDVRYLKSLPHNIKTADIPMPRSVPQNPWFKPKDFPGLDSPSRSTSANVSSHKRRKFVNVKKALPNSPLVTPGSPAWEVVQRKRNKPDVEHVPKGRPPPVKKSHEVFLFRYMDDETPASVLKYFKDVGVQSAHHARYCCSEFSSSKSFVLRFRDINEFKYIIRALPEYTGCRWYTSEPPSGDEGRPPGYFNYGGRIKGPDVESLLEDDEDESSMFMDASSEVTDDQGNNNSSDIPTTLNNIVPVSSPLASLSKDAITDIVTSAILSSNSTSPSLESTQTSSSISPVHTTTTVAGSSSDTATTASAPRTIMNSIKPLDSTLDNNKVSAQSSVNVTVG